VAPTTPFFKFVSSGVRRRQFSGDALAILSAIYRIFTHIFRRLYSFMARKWTYCRVYKGVGCTNCFLQDSLSPRKKLETSWNKKI